MELLGLGAAQLLGIFAAAGGAVLVLYLLKQRRRAVAVPFVRLWSEVLAEKQTTRLFAALKRILSFLLALLIIALLVFALGDPRLEGASADGRNLIVLVDASASMQATDVKPSRLDAAKKAVLRLIEELGPRDRMLIAQMETSTTPLSPLSDDPALLREAVEGLRATDLTVDLDRALAFARDVGRGLHEPEVVIVSDGVLGQTSASPEAGATPLKVSFVPIGSGGRNVAITAFAVRRYPLDKSRSEVLVELWNTGRREENVELELSVDGTPLQVDRITIAAGSTLRRFFDGVAGADKTLTAQIRLAGGGQDDLVADDRAWATLPERKRARVLTVSRGNRYLEAALLLDEYLEVTETSPEAYPIPGDTSRYDVVIFDDFVPSSPPRAHALYLHPAPREGVTPPLEVEEAMIPRPAFERLDRRHPLLRYTALSDVNVAEALKVRPLPTDKVVAADPRGPLIVTGARAGYTMIAFTFDVRRSDLPLRVAWPLLILNSIDYFVEESSPYLSSYRTGDVWYVPVPPGASDAIVVAPDGSRRSVIVSEGRAVVAGTRAGLYSLRAGGVELPFAVNPGTRAESEITPHKTLTIRGAEAGPVSQGKIGVRRELWLSLLLAVLLLVTLEWLTFHRRWTV